MGLPARETTLNNRLSARPLTRLAAAGRRFIRPRGTQVRYCFWPCGTQGLLRRAAFIVVWIPDVYGGCCGIALMCGL